MAPLLSLSPLATRPTPTAAATGRVLSVHPPPPRSDLSQAPAPHFPSPGGHFPSPHTYSLPSLLSDWLHVRARPPGTFNFLSFFAFSFQSQSPDNSAILIFLLVISLHPAFLESWFWSHGHLLCLFHLPSWGLLARGLLSPVVSHHADSPINPSPSS